MEDEELEMLRKKKMAELRQQQMQGEVIEEQKKEQDTQRQNLLRQILTPEAKERLTRFKLARPELAESIENQLIYLAQAGQIRGQITDAALRDLLARMAPQKREIKIERRG